jgi:hypothetical protein
MSVRPLVPPPSLEGADGELISVTITIEPRLLERLLDVLARLEFPINPQIYHDAATISFDANGVRLVKPASIVEFPAWAGRLDKLRDVLLGAGFDHGCLGVKSMLEDIRSTGDQEPAPPGAPYRAIVRSKHSLRAIA